MLESEKSALHHRYVFVGGLHRSGTSLVARMVGQIEGVARIRDAPVPENEGVYLQGAIPHDALAGRPMHFATDPAQHLVEGHPLDRLETRIRMEADWAPWFGSGPWRVEKSPVNLTRMRLLQQLFPLSQFIVVLRHPEAVAAAVAKWVDHPSEALLDHWIAAHRRVAQDLARLHSAMVLRYEDLVAAPASTQRALAAFLDMPPPENCEPIRNGNADYPDAPRMTPQQEVEADRWGYKAGLVCGPMREQAIRHPLRSIREKTESAFAEG